MGSSHLLSDPLQWALGRPLLTQGLRTRQFLVPYLSYLIHRVSLKSD